MSNWVKNEIIIKSDNTDQMAKLVKDMRIWVEEIHYPDKNLDDLERLAKGAGLKNINARGEVKDIKDKSADEIYIAVNTLNIPQNAIWFALAEKYLDNPIVLFISYDKNNNLYISNDEDYVGKYWFEEYYNPCKSENEDESDEDDETIDWINYREEEKNVISELKRCLKSKNDNIKDLLEELENNEYWSKHMFIRKWEYSNI